MHTEPCMGRPGLTTYGVDAAVGVGVAAALSTLSSTLMAANNSCLISSRLSTLFKASFTSHELVIMMINKVA